MKNIFLAVFSAVLLSISWPTYGFPFFIFMGFLPLLILEDYISGSDIRRKSLYVFALSYLCFVIWNISTTGWLYNAQNPDGTPAVMAVVIPVVVNSLLMSITFQIYHLFKAKGGLVLSLVFFVATWMSFEKFHLEWEFTWPWLNLGNVFADYPKVIQWYDTLGATGGSFWILIVNAFGFYLFKYWKEDFFLKYRNKRLVVLLGLIVVPIGFSLFKYYTFSEKPIGSAKIMMLQPNLNPYTEKYEKDSLQIVEELLALASNKEKVDYYLAPETAFPGTGGISERGLNQSASICMVQNLLHQKPNSIFVGGVSTYKIYRDESEKSETASFYPTYDFWIDHYNSAIQIIPNYEFDIYHKGKLVPGVEIFPYMKFLKPILGDAMLNFGGTIASLGIDKERKVFKNPYNMGKLAPIICYESIYGEYTSEYVHQGANFLAIVTNDSWWGVSQGHRQLLAYAKLRAIETRREIARSANSGISAHIDARGEVLKQTNYGEKSVLISDIQFYENQTIYTKIGDILSKICVVVFMILLVINFVRSRIFLK